MTSGCGPLSLARPPCLLLLCWAGEKGSVEEGGARQGLVQPCPVPRGGCEGRLSLGLCLCGIMWACWKLLCGSDIETKR